MKQARKASRLRSLSTRPPGAERPVVHVDPAIGKADGPHRKKLRTYLGIVARDKVDVTDENWKKVPTAQKDLIWEDIQAKFEILEASDSRTKRKLLQTFKSDLTRKWALAADQDNVDDTVCEKYDISKEKWALFFQNRRDPSWEDVRKKAQEIQKQNTATHVLSRGGYEYLEQKLLTEKTKKKLEEVARSGNVDGVIDPPTPIRRHDSFEEQDVLTVAIGRPEHPERVRAAGANVTIKQYFGSAPRTDQLEESITEKVTRQLMALFSQMQSQMQSQGLALPPEPLVSPSGPRETVSPAKPPQKPDPEVDDPFYLMTLTIPELFLRPYQSSKHDVYLGAYLNGGYWQMVVIVPKEHLVVWFCSLHNRPDNYLKGIINSLNQRLLLGGLSLSVIDKKGSTECGYYVMHWMSTIILESFRNNWEAYFNDARPLEPERLKALRIQWAQQLGAVERPLDQLQEPPRSTSFTGTGSLLSGNYKIY
ncbi:hypothetical protein HKD37_02G004955 [Glycine soja]